MKALSVQQPWADAIVRFGKDIENRTWHTAYRGLVAIHAGQKMRGWEDFEHLARLAGYREDYFDGREFEVGGVVGVARIVDCSAAHPSKWFDGPFGFVLHDAKPITFIPCRGSLGIFDLPSDVAGLVAARL